MLKCVRPTERKSNAGAPRRDEVLMFKGLVIQQLYGLSDEQLEYQIEDRRSFQRFLGLDSYRRAPDTKTAEKLVEAGKGFDVAVALITPDTAEEAMQAGEP